MEKKRSKKGKRKKRSMKNSWCKQVINEEKARRKSAKIENRKEKLSHKNFVYFTQQKKYFSCQRKILRMKERRKSLPNLTP